MRVVIILLALILVFCPPAGAGTATLYFASEPDLPLPPGFVEDAEQSTVFDTGGARILDLVAVATKSADIGNFYAETLPGLGWQNAGSGQFTRDRERLRIDVNKDGSHTFLRIRVEPVKNGDF
jgi:hypothetical protein